METLSLVRRSTILYQIQVLDFEWNFDPDYYGIEAGVDVPLGELVHALEICPGPCPWKSLHSVATCPVLVVVVVVVVIVVGCR